ncbi:MAG: T9SS type A sorting domain-containing protein [Saprospiraceae bacterium]|nr:T9SS type A sorting domain-containing protein [Saprospiraceae bacterium]MDW8483201.1 T9SS type A sorting domain-containing protein [Saprospiraceae bacterium]
MLSVGLTLQSAALWAQGGYLEFMTPVNDPQTGLTYVDVKWHGILQLHVVGVRIEINITGLNVCVDPLTVDVNSVHPEFLLYASHTNTQVVIFREEVFQFPLQTAYDPLIRVYFRASPGTLAQVSAGVCRIFPTPFSYHLVLPVNYVEVTVPGAYRVGGLIRKTPGVTAECQNGINAGISNVQVQYRGLKTGCFPYIPVHFPTNPHTIVTPNGQYFTWVPSHYQYTITPYKNSRCDCGLDYGDLDFVRKIILGIVEQPTLAQLIAADFNGSGFVSTFDMVNMIQCMNGTWNPPAGWSSWRFIPIPVYNANNPFSGVNLNSLPSSITTPLVTSNQMNHQFYGIKRGDVDGSCSDCDDQYPPLQDPPAEARQAPYVLAESEDVHLEKGAKHTIPVVLSRELTGVSILTLSLGYDPARVEILGVDPVALSSENFLTLAEDAAYNLAWFSPQVDGETLEKNAILFNITIRSKENNLRASEALWQEMHKNDRMYSADGQAILRWQWSSGDAARAFHIRALGPNPTQDEFYLAIEAPSAEKAEINLFDMQGKLCRNYSYDLQEGYQQIRLTDLPSQSGLYVLQVVAGKHRFVTRISKI